MLRCGPRALTSCKKLRRRIMVALGVGDLWYFGPKMHLLELLLAVYLGSKLHPRESSWRSCGTSKMHQEPPRSMKISQDPPRSPQDHPKIPPGRPNIVQARPKPAQETGPKSSKNVGGLCVFSIFAVSRRASFQEPFREEFGLHLGSKLASCWRPWGVLGPSWGHLGRPGGPQELSGGSPGGSGRLVWRFILEVRTERLEN